MNPDLILAKDTLSRSTMAPDFLSIIPFKTYIGNSFRILIVCFRLLPALAGFEKSLADSSGHGILSRQAVRHRNCFAVRYGLQLVSLSTIALSLERNSL